MKLEGVGLDISNEQLKVDISNQQSDLSICNESVLQVVRASVSFEIGACHEVSISFLNGEEMGALHDQYFGDPSITDCMSFHVDAEMDPISHSFSYKVLGDVVVCPKVAIQYSLENGGDSYRELTLYVVHGLLHLMGYDDMDPDSRVKMRKAEKRHMEHLDSLGLKVFAEGS